MNAIKCKRCNLDRILRTFIVYISFNYKVYNILFIAINTVLESSIVRDII